MNNMKVLMFGWEFPPHISGGLGTACLGLTRGLKTFNDIELTFVVPKIYGDEDTSNMHIMGAGDITVSDKYIEIHKKLKYIEVKSRLIPYSSPEEYFNFLSASEYVSGISTHYTDKTVKFQFSGGYGANLFEEITNYAIVASSIANDVEHDIIHAHDWLTYPAGIAAKNISGKPLVIHVHATDFDRSGGKVNPLVYAIEKRGMDAADKIIAVSNFTRNIIINKYGIKPSKVITLHNAVDTIVLNQSNTLEKVIEEKVVTFLGRITMQKGPEYFIEAADKVLKKTDNVRFVMAGSGDMYEKMITRVARLKIADRFHFTGFLKGDDVYKMFSLSDVYVMPSISEPFGISPLEAMMANVPVIISHQSGVSEVLNYAIKVDFWDIDAMADAIYGLIKYPALPTMLKTNGKEEVNSIQWENSAAILRDIYYDVLKKVK